MLNKAFFIQITTAVASKIGRLSLAKKGIITLVALFVIGGEFYNFQNSSAPFVADQTSNPTPSSTPAETPASSLQPSAEPSPTQQPLVQANTGTVLGSKTTTAPTVSIQQSSSQTSSSNNTVTAAPTPTNTPVPTTQPTSAPTNTPEPTAIPTPVAQQVTVSIGGSDSYQTAYKTNQKACDFTRTVAAEHGITLDIRHDSDLNTDGIWVINGIGNPNSMFWTYKINGASPVWGCSHPNSPTIQANDIISWEYIGS